MVRWVLEFLTWEYNIKMNKYTHQKHFLYILKWHVTAKSAPLIQYFRYFSVFRQHRFSSSTWCYVNPQNTKIYLKQIHYSDKILLILYPSVRNSLTHFVIKYVLNSICYNKKGHWKKGSGVIRAKTYKLMVFFYMYLSWHDKIGVFLALFFVGLFSFEFRD